MDDHSETTNCERYLGALTTGDRGPWAQTREKHFSKGVNRKSLDAIEKVIKKFLVNLSIAHYTIYIFFLKAAFVVVLVDEEYELTPVNSSIICLVVYDLKYIF